ncbi:hypothetical protein [Rhizobium bangladeshense]|uniref:hypothetical protein n=1 Tax=Rhizobium bangladeshense TaxID=1138189 RepID=UPI001FD9A627|nr:hypothetical protein [Rhizobium bangladeshense]
MPMSFKWSLAAIMIGFAAMSGVAQAESFSRLAQQNFAVGKLTKGKAGGYGWVVSNGSKRFFCRLNASLAYVNKKGMVGITSSGRLIKVDTARRLRHRSAALTRQYRSGAIFKLAASSRLMSGVVQPLAGESPGRKAAHRADAFIQSVTASFARLARYDSAGDQTGSRSPLAHSSIVSAMKSAKRPSAIALRMPCISSW